MLENTFLIAQFFGGIAFVTQLFAFQQKQRVHILIFFTIGNFLWAVHSFLLFDTIAAGLFALGGVRSFIFIFWRKKWILHLFLITAIIIFVLNYKSFVSIFSFLAAVFMIIGTFQEKEKVLRKFMMGAPIMWIINNIFIFSPIGIVAFFVSFLNQAFSFWRHHLKNKD